LKWVDHLLMVINMDESKLCTIIQIEAFLAASLIKKEKGEQRRFFHSRRG